MKKVEEFRRRAAECRDLSVKGPTAEIREHYRSLADMWDRLADERMTFIYPRDPQESA